jgi:hypothetical protein
MPFSLSFICATAAKVSLRLISMTLEVVTRELSRAEDAVDWSSDSCGSYGGGGGRFSSSSLGATSAV